MGFSRVALAHQNMWFGKKMYKRVMDEESLILVGNVVTHGWVAGRISVFMTWICT